MMIVIIIILIIIDFREGEGEGARNMDDERVIDWLPPAHTLMGIQPKTCAWPGMGPGPLGPWRDAQSTEPPQLGNRMIIIEDSAVDFHYSW